MGDSPRSIGTESEGAGLPGWRWMLVAGLAVPLASLILARLSGSACSSLSRTIPGLYQQDWHVTLPLCKSFPDLFGCEPGVGLLTGHQIADLCGQVAGWMGPLLNVVLAFGAALWVTRRAGLATALPGVGVGLISALGGAIILALHEMEVGLLGGVQGVWNLGMLLLTVGAGWLGGVAGRATLAEREALHQASRAIGVAGEPQAIAAAVGEYLVDRGVNRVSLWELVPSLEAGAPQQARKGIRLMADWVPGGGQVLLARLRLDTDELPSLACLHEGTALQVHPGKGSPQERARWEQLGIRFALLLPLAATGGTVVGVLALGSRTARGLRRGMGRAEVLKPQVALALQNWRLVQQAQQAAVLDERQRLAREIHDTLAQGFTSIVMHLEAAEGALPDGAATLREHLVQAREMAREGLVQARRLVWAMRPEILERTSLPQAIERVVEQWAEASEVEAGASITGEACPLPPAVEVALLRAVQEALANVRKHAQASRVCVTLSFMGDLVVLDVQDDGAGFDPELPGTAGAFGLAAMRERVEQLDGTLIVESMPGGGTTLVVEIPIPRGFAR
jgi:signal transduction histidine kinase